MYIVECLKKNKSRSVSDFVNEIKCSKEVLDNIDLNLKIEDSKIDYDFENNMSFIKDEFNITMNLPLNSKIVKKRGDKKRGSSVKIVKTTMDEILQNVINLNKEDQLKPKTLNFDLEDLDNITTGKDLFFEVNQKETSEFNRLLNNNKPLMPLKESKIRYN